MQNFAPGGFSAEHFWQRINISPHPAMHFLYHRRSGQDYRGASTLRRVANRRSRGARSAFLQGRGLLAQALAHHPTGMTDQGAYEKTYRLELVECISSSDFL